MRRPALVLVGFLLLFGASATKAQTPAAASKPAASASKASTAPNAIHLPIFFEANQGQADSRVQFLSRSKGYTLLLTPTETVLAETKTQVTARPNEFGPFQPSLNATKSTSGSEIRMQLVDANSAPTMKGRDELPGKVNYLIGNDAAHWHTNVPLYSQVQTKRVYPGVDLVFHGDQRELEYDFVVAPGADPSKIAFRISGAARMEIDARGDLVLHATDSDFVMHKPVIYQTIAAERRPIEGSFVRKGKDEVAFGLGAYDHSQELVIDPAIAFASFLGGGAEDVSGGFAIDDSTPGSPKLYLSGFTGDSTTFPEKSTTIGSGTTMTPPAVIEVGFVAKIDPTATGAASLVYLTFMGGSVPNLSKAQGCLSAFVWLALDKSQGPSNIVPVMGGETNCSDFPSATVLNPVTDPSSTSNGITTMAVRMVPSGAAIDKAAALGGNHDVGGGFVAVGTGGNVILSGETQANNLPTKNAYVNSFDNGATPQPYDDCFVTILNRADLTINYMTYLNVGGGSTSGDGAGCGAFEDASGNILAGGNTPSPTAFNLGPGGASLANGFQTTFQGTRDTFAMELNPTLVGVNQLKYATYFGGGGDTRAGNGSFDLGNGVVAIVGATTSNAANGKIPLKNPYQMDNNATGDGMTGYLLLINTMQTGAASLQCATYFGGSGGDDIVGAVTYDAGDPTDYRIVLGGRTTSATDFPTMNSLQPYVGAVVNGMQSPDGFLSILKVPTPAQTAFNATLVFSTYIGGANPPASLSATQPPTLLEDDRINAVAIDANHTVYAVGESNAPGGFFANTNPTTTVNGFQTTCSSCSNQSPSFPEDDVVVFSLGTGANATLQSIAVAPTSASITVGQTQQFSAIGNYNDGTEKDITSLVTWSTVPTGFATMSTTSPGLATGTAVGTTQVTPALNGVPVLNTGALTVTAGAVATHFSVSAPATATSGTAVNVTVTALDANNATVTTYAGTVHFTSSDTQAVLPSNSALVSGVGTFPVVLVTAGAQTISATDTVTASITGTSGTITVSSVGPPNPVLNISKTHVGNFTQGQQGAQYSLTVSNTGTGSTNGGQSGTATVQSTGSIYNTGGGSTAPTMMTLPSGATSVVFSGVTGSITAGCASTEGCIILNHGTGDNPNDPDGVGAAPATSSNTGAGSISGITGPGAGYLVGVFVPAGGPTGTAPTALDFTSSGLGTAFTSLSPQLDQVFFIGDGQTGNGTGTQQVFNVPAGAGQLWLGISDAAFYNGAPGAYGDNLGAYSVGFTVSAPGSGGVTVTETAPAGLTLVSMAGTGWTCGSPNPANACTRSDTLAGGAAYPVITATVNVAADATSPQVNMAGVTGGGSAPASASDSTVIEGASTAATHFSVTAPPSASTAAPISFTVTALTASNATATGYAGTVHFTSSDPAAVLPANMVLTSGVGTFPATLNTMGSQTITATDTETASITGTSAAINVTSAAAVVLTVQTAGTGTGTVMGNGINCVSGSANGCMVSLAAGTQVVLTQMVTGGSTFAGWSGTPTMCTVAGATCSFTMPATAETVSATFTAAAATLKSIAVTPANPTEPINSSLQFTATGTYSDNSTKDISTTVTWASSNTDASTINAAGLASTGGTAGLTTTISATLNEVTGSTLLTISNSPISVSVTPPAGGSYPPVPPGGTLAVGIVLTAIPGFSGTVTFGCTTSSPTITCAPDPASVVMTPNGPTDVAIVLNTFCKGTTTGLLVPASGGSGRGIALLLFSLMLGGLAWMWRRNPRWAVSFAVLVLMGIGGAACSGLPKGPNGATQPGNYTVTFTASVNGTTTSTAPIPFTVE